MKALRDIWPGLLISGAVGTLFWGITMCSHAIDRQVDARNSEIIAARAKSATTVPAGPATFAGYNCHSHQCAGHQAGWEWASEHDITDLADCEGNSQSFIEGCEAYVTNTDADQQQEN